MDAQKKIFLWMTVQFPTLFSSDRHRHFKSTRSFSPYNKPHHPLNPKRPKIVRLPDVRHLLTEYLDGVDEVSLRSVTYLARVIALVRVADVLQLQIEAAR